MRILITGATGLIGKEVGKRLSQKGWDIHVVSRRPEHAKRELPFPATIFHWQGTAEPFPEAALVGVDAVLHLAGETVAGMRWNSEKKRAIRDSRIFGTRALATAIARMEKPPGIFVQGSAIGFYGDRGDETLTESSHMGHGFLAEVVRDWEAESAILESKGIRVVKVRTGVVLSRREGAMAKLIPLFSTGLGGQLASGQQWMSWIHIVDIARLFLFCLENSELRGVVNGSAPEPAQNSRFTVALARALGRWVFFPVPATALRLVLGEGAEAVLASQRVLPERVQELGFHFQYPELVGALTELAAPYKDCQHELVAEQWVPRSCEEVFPFFCEAKNLENITPPFLNFKVLGQSTAEIGDGTLIDYRLSLHGIPVRWQSRIESWEPNRQFVDRQLRGPYQLWHHTHEFIPLAGGTLLRDRVLYRLPMGLLGEIVAGWKVKGDVTSIFSFRRKIIDELFGQEREKQP